MRTIKLQPQELDLPERKVRLRLPGRLGAELDTYRELYARTHGQEIDLAALIEGILAQFLASDRGYQSQRRGGRKTAPAPVSCRSHGGDTET